MIEFLTISTTEFSGISSNILSFFLNGAYPKTLIF